MMTIGKTGHTYIGENGDRLTNFELWSFGPGCDSYYRYGTVDLSLNSDQVRRNIILVFAYSPLSKRQNEDISIRSR